MFHVHLRKKWSLLSLDEMCCGYQLGPTGPMYYLKPVFPYFLSRWSVCWYEWGIKVPHYYCVTVQFSHSVVSDSFWPHGLQYARFPCLLPTHRLAQTHVHQVGDAIQPVHPLLSPSPPVFNLSQHQGLFQWVSSLQQGAKVLEFQLQHLSFQWIVRIDFH